MREKGRAHLVEVLAAPLSSMLAGVAIEDGEVALSTNASEVVDERVGATRRMKRQRYHPPQQLKVEIR